MCFRYREKGECIILRAKGVNIYCVFQVSREGGVQSGEQGPE